MHPASLDHIAIAVFAKAPVSGYAKTRLIPALGEAGAAVLQGHFIERTLRTAVESGVGPVSLWCAPDCSHPFFRACAARYQVALKDQEGADLGERMLRAFRSYEPCPAIVIGTDCPALTGGHLRDCAARLREGDDAVFLPAEDGGYVLVGLRHPIPVLFAGISWGGEHVMQQTRQCLRDSVLRWSEPAVLWDVDDIADLARFDCHDFDGALACASGTVTSRAQPDGPGDE